jgi:hypothetical protein
VIFKDTHVWIGKYIFKTFMGLFLYFEGIFPYNSFCMFKNLKMPLLRDEIFFLGRSFGMLKIDNFTRI